ncbi:MAG: hypothetical protein HYZ53_25390 [Planctomycetes bacterium]|nr:hypothetical protein [Planctomycetota bacterium]
MPRRLGSPPSAARGAPVVAALAAGLALAFATAAALRADDREGRSLGQTAFLTRITRQAKEGPPERLWSGTDPDTPQAEGEQAVIDHVLPLPPKSEIHFSLVLASPDVAEVYLVANDPQIQFDPAGAELTELGGLRMERIVAPIKSRALAGGVRERYLEGPGVPGGTFTLHDKFVQGDPILFRRRAYTDQEPLAIDREIDSGTLRLEDVTDEWLARRDKKLVLRLPCRFPRATGPELLDFQLVFGVRWVRRPK